MIKTIKFKKDTEFIFRDYNDEFDYIKLTIFKDTEVEVEIEEYQDFYSADIMIDKLLDKSQYKAEQLRESENDYSLEDGFLDYVFVDIEKENIEVL